jgi:hypothetical protein
MRNLQVVNLQMMIVQIPKIYKGITLVNNQQAWCSSKSIQEASKTPIRYLVALEEVSTI